MTHTHDTETIREVLIQTRDGLEIKAIDQCFDCGALITTTEKV